MARIPTGSNPTAFQRLAAIPVGPSILLIFTLLMTGRYTGGADSDTIWHLLAGDYMLQTHAILKTDVFSWTMLGKEWFPAEWLYEAVISILNRWFSVKGLILFHLAGNLIQMALMYRMGRRLGASSLLSSLISGAMTYAMLPYITLRPQIFSYFMFTWMLSILLQRREKPYLVYMLPIVTLIWVNFHLSFILLILWAAFEWGIGWISIRADRLSNERMPHQLHLLAAWLLCLIASLINPETYHVYPYVFSMSSNNDLKNNIIEYLSPNFHNDAILQGFLVPASIIWLVALATRGTVPLRIALYMVGTFSLSLISIRYYPYFLICSAVFLFPASSELWKHLRFFWLKLMFLAVEGTAHLPERLLVLWKPVLRLFRQSWIIHLAALLTLIWALVFSFPSDWQKGTWEQMERDYPHGAVAYLKEHQLTGRVFNAYTWGGFFEQNGIPAFVDGRTDLFLQTSVFMDYIRINNINPDTDAILKNYDPTAIVMPTGSNVVTYLQHSPFYKEAYRDGTATIFVRK